MPGILSRFQPVPILLHEAECLLGLRRPGTVVPGVALRNHEIAASAHESLHRGVGRHLEDPHPVQKDPDPGRRLPPGLGVVPVPLPVRMAMRVVLAFLLLDSSFLQAPSRYP